MPGYTTDTRPMKSLTASTLEKGMPAYNGLRRGQRGVPKGMMRYGGKKAKRGYSPMMIFGVK
jgi:hypothetical protein